MTTKLQRINLSVEQNLVDELTFLAKSNHKSVAGFVKELIREAIDKREDAYLAKLANDVDIDGAETISHEEFWD
jgi:predicted DNA-binding protein